MFARFATAMLAAALFVTNGAHASAVDEDHDDHGHRGPKVEFSIRSVESGDWSNPKTWQPARVPKAGDRVLVSRHTHVRYDVASRDVIRLLQIVGTLQFARDRDTELNVAIVKVQNSTECSESGFACDFRGVNRFGEPGDLFPLERPQLIIGTPEEPIPAEHTAKIRLHYIDGMSKEDAPALVCCSARMDIHGSPLSRTWVKLGADAKKGDTTVTLAEAVNGWRVGDEVIVTGSLHQGSRRSFRHEPDRVQTEERTITKIEGNTLTLNAPLTNIHFGSGDFRSEVANLSRNVVVESADPAGVRGHTLYHRNSAGGISYARFAHLGKEGVLGRYAIHFHLIGDTMRGTQVQGVAIVDSHNRWVTVHGAQYLVVRDCVGYQSVGHGFFLEDATEAYNLLDRNLGVQAFHGKRLPRQVLPFDPNDGAAFWWTNGRNSFTRNVACENDEYGFRYDCQDSGGFDAQIPLLMPSGEKQSVDVRHVPLYRFQENEAHTEGLYGMVFAGNQRTERDRIGPDREHPHIVRNNAIWQVHYGLRPQIPRMLVENLRIDHAAYGIYRPMYDDHVYRRIAISNTSGEPFNRGLDDQSEQYGRITVDGLSFVGFYKSAGLPLVQMSDNNATGEAESHFRNVHVKHGDEPRRPWFDRGGGAQVERQSERGVPCYLHDYFGEGRTAKIVLNNAERERAANEKYASDEPLTGREAQVAEVDGVEFPELLSPVDDLPPATVITSVRREGDKLIVRGVAHDNGAIASVKVNDQPARIVATAVDGGVVDWEIALPRRGVESVIAQAVDAGGNEERHFHQKRVE